MNFLAFFNLSGTDLVIILFIFLLIFGARKLPELARGLGQSMKEFKKATSDLTEPLEDKPVNVKPANPVGSSSQAKPSNEANQQQAPK